jgi:hypothetical protein
MFSAAAPCTAHPGSGLRDVGLDPLQIVRRQFDSIGSDVFLETMHLGRAWDRGDPRSLCQQPREGDLRARCILGFGGLAEQLDQRKIRLPRFLPQISADCCVRRCPRTSCLR